MELQQQIEMEGFATEFVLGMMESGAIVQNLADVVLLPWRGGDFSGLKEEDLTQSRLRALDL
jgi:hypothetical protein